MKYTIFETFVGAGGSHLGFKKQGFISKYVNDNDENCIKTLKYNNPELKKNCVIDLGDILTLNPSEILKRTNMSPGDLDVMFGGIVCKGFSLAGERSPNDPRNYYYRKQLELVNHIRPKISIIENVPGILSAKVLNHNIDSKTKEEVDLLWENLEKYKGQKANLRKQNLISKEFLMQGEKLREAKINFVKKLEKTKKLISVFDDIKEIYEEIGYKVYYKILNAAWYGAYTKRERAFIVAVRDDIKIDFIFPQKKYDNKNIPFKTVNQAFKLIDYQNKKDNDNIPMNHKEKTIERFKYIPEGGCIANHIDKLPKELKISKFYSRGSTMRLDGNVSSPTLVPGHSNFPVHPKYHRSITVREAATITGFPTSYVFFGSHTKRCEHVGNAVPIKLAEALAIQSRLLLDEYYELKNWK